MPAATSAVGSGGCKGLPSCVEHRPDLILGHQSVKLLVAGIKIDEAGCFVLLTNLLDQQADWPADELLSLYKSQIGIEKNFSFLKDPAIVNSIFLKKAERIEVLGLVLLISLLIWRLMERSLRQYVESNDCTLPGWVRRQTKKPITSFHG
jgi:transposase